MADEHGDLDQLTLLLRQKLESDKSDSVKGLVSKIMAVASPVLAVLAAIWAFAVADTTKSAEFKALQEDVAALKKSAEVHDKRLNEELLEVSRLKILAEQSAKTVERLDRKVYRLGLRRRDP